MALIVLGDGPGEDQAIRLLKDLSTGVVSVEIISASQAKIVESFVQTDDKTTVARSVLTDQEAADLNVKIDSSDHKISTT